MKIQKKQISVVFFINIFRFKINFLIPNKIRNRIAIKTKMEILTNKNIKAN